VYLEGIRVGVRDRSYAIPFWALALNFAWEVVNTIHGALAEGIAVQVVINAIWAVFDLGILATYFRYGRKDFPGGPAGRLVFALEFAGPVHRFCGRGGIYPVVRPV